MSTSAFVLVVLKELFSSSNKESKSTHIECDFITNVKSLEGLETEYLFEQNDYPYNAIVKVSTTSLNSLNRIVLGKISKLPTVKETKTMIVIET